jgi:hypothetical protein
MKLTKSKLKQIIKEQLALYDEQQITEADDHPYAQRIVQDWYDINPSKPRSLYLGIAKRAKSLGVDENTVATALKILNQMIDLHKKLGKVNNIIIKQLREGR